MNEAHFDLLSKFSSLRSWFAPHADSTGVVFRQRAADETLAATSGVDAAAYYEALLMLPVARPNPETGVRSLIKDMVWDFNGDYPNSPRSVRGAALRMDWSKYTAVSALVLLEMKVAFYLYYLAPSHVYGGRKSKNKKATSIIMNFSAGMRFLDQMSLCDQEEFGRDYVQRIETGVRGFDTLSYREAAKQYDFIFNSALKVFFNVIRAPYFAENVFGGFLPHVDLNKLQWAHIATEKASGATDKVVSEVLSNKVFEHSSLTASMLIVDFLATLGESVVDIDSLRRRDARAFNRADEHELTPRLLNMYTLMRLKQAGYPENTISSVMGEVPDELMSPFQQEGASLISVSTVKKIAGGLINRTLRKYLDQLYYSCCYIVAQYSGMRPSELSQITFERALSESGQYWVLNSHVVKHRNAYGKLFDDTWVAIPIVRDAVAAAKILAKYKQTPFLFAPTDTVAPGAKPVEVSSVGMKYHLMSFFEYILPEDEYKALGFYPYMLRHTLAYQLYRAEVGLPFISHQLKHFGDIIGGYYNRGFSAVTLVYGHIGDLIEMGGRQAGKSNKYRFMAEREVVRLHYDPEGTYAGANGAAHKAKNKAIFKMYEDAGYTYDEVINALVAQGIAVVNVGMGMCYGGRVEEFDESLPCIGGLRCNPNRCANSVITKAHAPKWREIYTQNRALLTDPFYQDRLDQINEVINEAKGVLDWLGEATELEV